MGKKLYVGGLSWSTNEDGLRDGFERYGQLEEVKVITDRETGRSRGFGFVTFARDEDAAQAISEMNGKEFEGRQITVNEARDREPGEFRGGGGGGGGGGRGRGGGGGGRGRGDRGGRDDGYDRNRW